MIACQNIVLLTSAVAHDVLLTSAVLLQVTVGHLQNGFRLDGLRQGDRIEVFSAGNQLNGVGTFIRIRDGFLVWVNEDGNITSTSLDTISISRVSGTM